MRIRGRIARAFVATLALAFLPVAAKAATVEGTIVSNVVSATYSTTAVPGIGSGYAVTYSATARVLAQDPCIDIQKFAEPALGQVSGEVVTFRIWVINCSASASAFNIFVYDQLPLNTDYFGSWGSEPPGDWGNAWSWTGVDGPYTAGNMPSVSATGNEWLRYKLSRLGPNKSAWVSYQVSIQ